MDLSKKACLSNTPRTNTLVLDSKQKTTGVTGQYDAFPTLFSGVGNRSVGTALPAQHIQPSGMPFAVHPSLTFEERQVADQPTDHSSKILYDQKKVDILGNKFENPVSTESTGGLDASLTVSKPSQSSTKVKCRRKGSHFSEYAIASLEQICIYGIPSREAMECVAKDTGLSYKQVRAWCYHKKTKEQKRLAKLENPEVNELPLKKRAVHKLIREPLELWVVTELKIIFKNSPHVGMDEVAFLAKRYGVTERKIRRWFSYERYKLEKIKCATGVNAESSVDSSKGPLIQPTLSSDLSGDRVGHLNNGPKKRKRKFDSFQQEQLNRFYKEDKYPSPAGIKRIATIVNCIESRVENFFRNTRTKYRGKEGRRAKKRGSEVSCVLSANVTLNKAEKPVSGHQIQQPPVRPRPSAALGAAPLSSGEQGSMPLLDD